MSLRLEHRNKLGKLETDGMFKKTWKTTSTLCQAPFTGSKMNSTTVHQLNWKTKLEYSLTR